MNDGENAQQQSHEQRLPGGQAKEGGQQQGQAAEQEIAGYGQAAQSFARGAATLTNSAITQFGRTPSGSAITNTKPSINTPWGGK